MDISKKFLSKEKLDCSLLCAEFFGTLALALSGADRWFCRHRKYNERKT